MCTGAEVGLILAATGAAANHVNTQQALKKQDSLAARGIRNQSELQRKASQRTSQHIDEFSRSNPDAERAQSLEGFMNALRASQGSTDGDVPAVGAANPRFAEDVGAGRQRTNMQAGERAGRMATIDAPMHQRLRESMQANMAGVDIGELHRQSGAEDFLTRLRVSAAQPNSTVGGIASLMQGVGGAMAMMPAGGAAAAGAGTAGAPMTGAAVAPGAMTNQTLAQWRRAINPYG